MIILRCLESPLAFPWSVCGCFDQLERLPESQAETRAWHRFSVWSFSGGHATIGWLVGIAGRGIIESVDHWVAFILLGYIGGKMVYDA